MFQYAAAFLNLVSGNVRSLNAWDVRLIVPGGMSFIFGGEHAEPLCGNEWILSAPAATAGVLINNTQIVNTRGICHCRAGTHYQLRATVDIVEGCAPCPRGTFSLGGYTLDGHLDECTSCLTLGREHFCVRGKRVVCSFASNFACWQGEYFSALGIYISDATNATEACTPGHFCPGGKNLTKYLCTPGTYTDMSSSTTCMPCPRGQVARGQGSMGCEICPAGTQEIDGAECVPCGAGARSEMEGAITCTNCEPGKYAQFDGASACYDCPPRGVNCFNSDGGGALQLEPRFWRFDDSLGVMSNSEFYSCVACIVDDENYTFTCYEGHEVLTPVCGSCKNGYWMGNGICTAW